MKYFLILLLIIACYLGLFWFSTRNKTSECKLSFLLSSMCVLTMLIVFMYANLFFALFGAVLVLALASYIGDHKKIRNSFALKNGAFGGLWLSIPIYVYLVSNT